MIYQYHPDTPTLYPPQSVTNTVPMVGTPATPAGNLPPTGFQAQPLLAIAILMIMVGVLMLYKRKMINKARKQS